MGGCEDSSPSDMTRECLEKREMVFYMFFMCFNARGGGQGVGEKV